MEHTSSQSNKDYGRTVRCSKRELTRSFHRHVLQPFSSVKGSDDKWTHTATDLSGEDASVKAIAEAAWTDDVKTAYKTFRESQDS